MTPDDDVLDLDAEPTSPPEPATWSRRRIGIVVGVLTLVATIIVAILTWPRGLSHLDLVGLRSTPTTAWQRTATNPSVVPIGHDRIALLQQDSSDIIVLDTATGYEVWTTQAGDVPARLQDLPGTEQLLLSTVSGDHIFLDRNTGEERHRLQLPTLLGEMATLWPGTNGNLAVIRMKQDSDFMIRTTFTLLDPEDLDQELWTVDLPPEMPTLVERPFEQVDDVLLLPGNWDNIYVHAMRANDGDPMPWATPGHGIAVIDEMAIVAREDALYGFDFTTGKELWRGDPLGDLGPFVVDSNLYGTAQDNPEQLIRVDPTTGEQLWTADHIFPLPWITRVIGGVPLTSTGSSNAFAVLNPNTGEEISRIPDQPNIHALWRGDGQIVAYRATSSSSPAAVLEAIRPPSTEPAWTIELEPLEAATRAGQHLIIVGPDSIRLLH